MDHHKVEARFGVFNGDAKGTVVSINSQEVTYTFDHDLETIYEHSRKWFNSSTYGLDTDTE
jgi:hypothetical protein